MTLIEKLERQYKMAIEDIDKTMLLPPQTQQQKQDYKKAIRAGRVPVKRTSVFEKMKHELRVEYRYKLKAILDIYDYLEERDYVDTVHFLKEVIGDAEKALNKRT